MVAAYEMMVVTPAIQNLIRENKTYRIDSSIQTGRKHGMFLLDESLFKLWQNGLVREGRVPDAAAASRPNWPPRSPRPRRGVYDEDDEDEDEDEDEDDEDDEDDDEPRREPRRR